MSLAIKIYFAQQFRRVITIAWKAQLGTPDPQTVEMAPSAAHRDHLFQAIVITVSR
jgi:hypothetical protein